MNNKLFVYVLLGSLFGVLTATNLMYAAEVDNAAIYYSKAFELQKYNESTEMRERMQKVIRKGWQGKDPELEQFIIDNESALSEIVEGLKLDKCDFDYGRRYSYLVEKKTPPVAKVIRLANLFLLRGRYLASQEKPKTALGEYFNSMLIAQQLSLDVATLSKLTALQIEERALPLVREYILKKAGKKELGEIINFLDTYMKNHFTMRKVVADEKALFLSSVSTITDKMPPESEFKKEFTQNAKLLADKYFGLIADATDPGNKDLFAVVEREINTLRQELKDIDRKYLDGIIKSEEQDLSKVSATQVVKYLLVIGLPELQKLSAYYHGRIFDLQSLKEAAQKKEREAEDAVKADTMTKTNDGKDAGVAAEK